MLLELKNVTKFFAKRCIFKGVSASIASKSITLLTGANGAGKTTLLRIMAGLSNPSLGEVIRHVDDKELGYLGHSTFMYPTLSAQENLQFWADVYGLEVCNQARIEDALIRVELLPFREEKAGNFSRGMSQRLNLARMLLLKPKLWLLDEPSSGLDIRSSALLLDEVLTAKDEGAGIVWISHDVQAHQKVADDVLHMEKARLSKIEQTV